MGSLRFRPMKIDTFLINKYCFWNFSAGIEFPVVPSRIMVAQNHQSQYWSVAVKFMLYHDIGHVPANYTTYQKNRLHSCNYRSLRRFEHIFAGAFVSGHLAAGAGIFFARANAWPQLDMQI